MQMVKTKLSEGDPRSVAFHQSPVLLQSGAGKSKAKHCRPPEIGWIVTEHTLVLR
jgi:hypothetical protein